MNNKIFFAILTLFSSTCIPSSSSYNPLTNAVNVLGDRADKLFKPQLAHFNQTFERLKDKLAPHEIAALSEAFMQGIQPGLISTSGEFSRQVDNILKENLFHLNKDIKAHTRDFLKIYKEQRDETIKKVCIATCLTFLALKALSWACKNTHLILAFPHTLYRRWKKEKAKKERAEIVEKNEISLLST